jgi:hypothetical protein
MQVLVNILKSINTLDSKFTTKLAKTNIQKAIFAQIFSRESNEFAAKSIG